jgi:hypothetical protein
MFMQIHADGVVLDTEGVHRIGPDLMKPLLSIHQDPELLRPRSHCGSPPTDFYEQFQVTIYRRAIGRIQANAFTYSGNTQGCDHSARRLHDALDAIQNKLSSPATVTATGSPPARLALEESGITPRRAVPTDNHQGHLPPPLPLAPIPDLEPPSR